MYQDLRTVWIDEDDVMRSHLVTAIGPGQRIFWKGEKWEPDNLEIVIIPKRVGIKDGEMMGSGNFSSHYRNTFKYEIIIGVPLAWKINGDVSLKANDIAGMISVEFWRKVYNQIKITRVAKNEIGDSSVSDFKGVYYRIDISLYCEHNFYVQR
jgi:hypothetical protein